MIATSSGITQFLEQEEMGLWSLEEYEEAIKFAGFDDFKFDPSAFSFFGSSLSLNGPQTLSMSPSSPLHRPSTPQSPG